MCRSTSAKLADRQSPQQRTSPVHREGSRTVKHSNSHTQTLIISFTHYFILGYVVDTYPPTTHTCNFYRQYVVVTYRPIIFISFKNPYPIRVILVN